MTEKKQEKGKDLFASKTTIGVIIFALSSLAGNYLGVDIDFEQQLKMIDVLSKFMPELGQYIIGPAVTAWGARSAKKPITSVMGFKLKKKVDKSND